MLGCSMSQQRGRARCMQRGFHRLVHIYRDMYFYTNEKTSIFIVFTAKCHWLCLCLWYIPVSWEYRHILLVSPLQEACWEIFTIPVTYLNNMLLNHMSPWHMVLKLFGFLSFSSLLMDIMLCFSWNFFMASNRPWPGSCTSSAIWKKLVGGPAINGSKNFVRASSGSDLA